MSTSPASPIQVPQLARIEAEAGPITRAAIDQLYAFVTSSIPWWMISPGMHTSRLASPLETWSPSWANTGVAQPSIGNGTLSASWTRLGSFAFATMTITWGSTTSGGDAAGDWTFTLPATPNGNVIATAYSVDASAGSFPSPPHFAIVTSGKTIKLLTNAGGALDPNTPMAWTTSDRLHVGLLYPVL